MKQKTLLLIRAIVCFVLIIVLGVLCIMPLFKYNLKISDETVSTILTVLNTKKEFLEKELETNKLSDNEDANPAIEKELAELNAFIDELNGAIYFANTSDVLGVASQMSSIKGVLPYGLTPSQDIETCAKELKKLEKTLGEHLTYILWFEEYDAWCKMKKQIESNTLTASELEEAKALFEDLEEDLFDLAKVLNIEAWAMEMTELEEALKEDENYKQWQEIYPDWYILKEQSKEMDKGSAELAQAEIELKQLEDELFPLARKINPEVYCRLRDDSLGYNISFSAKDLFSLAFELPAIISAAADSSEEEEADKPSGAEESSEEAALSPKKAPSVWSIMQINSAFELEDLRKRLSESDSPKTRLELEEEIADYEAELSDVRSYEGITVEHYKRAIAFALFFHFDSWGTPSDIGSNDIKLINDMLSSGDKSAFDTYVSGDVTFLAGCFILIFVMLILVIVIIVTIVNILKVLFSLGNLEKFFNASRKSFTSVSEGVMVLFALFTIGMGAKLSVYGILAVCAIVFGYIVCGVLTRCAQVSNSEARYLNVIQISALISAIGVMVVLFAGHNLMSGMTSRQTAYAVAVTAAGSLNVVGVIMGVMYAVLVVIMFGIMSMSIGLKRFACFKFKATRSSGEKPQNNIGGAVFIFIFVMVLVAMSILGMQFNVAGFLIGGLLMLVAEIAVVVLCKKLCSDLADADMLRLDTLGEKYFDPESAVGVPFFATSDSKAE